MIKRLLGLFAAALLSATSLPAQCGVTGDTIFVQTYDDLWALNSCDSIWGSLHIQNWDFSHLDSLQNLVWIEEHFIIDQCTSLLNVGGLSNLLEVGGNLMIRNNFTLQGLTGFSSINVLGGDLIIKGNITLVNVNGFSNLEQISGDLKLQENHTLEGLGGLQNVSQVGGDVLIEGQNIVLDDLSGLASLNQILGDLLIALPSGTSLDGLEALQTIGGDLSVTNMLILGNIDGLQGLQHVGGNCELGFNGSLVQIDGFSNLSSVGGDLYIHDNASLFFCCGIEPIIAAGGVDGQIILADNTNGCNSEEAILLACADNLTSESDVPVYWSVTDGMLKVAATVPSSIKIFDTFGRIIYSKGQYTKEECRIALQPGIYILWMDGLTHAERVLIPH
jgi:hypothetical protein